jgi:hypothetical protein
MHLVIVLVLFLVACTTKNTRKEIPQKAMKDDIREVIYDYDSTKFNYLKYHFFIDSKGNIFEKDISVKANDSIMEYYLITMDSLFCSYDSLTLKQVIDIDSYTQDSIDNKYAMDKNKVYWITNTIDGTNRHIIEEADPKTFEWINYKWAKDKKYVFFDGQIIQKADPKTLRVSGRNADSAEDKRHSYCDGEIVE